MKIPKDIANLSHALFSRELLDEDYPKLKQAYSSLEKEKDDFHHQYHILFFQHFLEHALKDETLRPDIAEAIPDLIKASFENDILKSITEFTSLLVNNGIQDYKREINLFFFGLSDWIYKDYSSAYERLFDGLKSRNNKFELFHSVESSASNWKAKIEFGNLLKSSQ